MAIIGNLVTKPVAFQLKQASTLAPVLATDAIAAEVGASKTDEDGDVIGYEWTPLSSYLHSIKTTIPTTSTISGWGFTKNVGTVTKVNNTSPDASGNVSITIPTLSVSATGTGFIKDFSVNGHSITITKEDINTFFDVATTTSTAFSPCGGNDTVSENNHKVTVVTGISANGSTVTANLQQIDFGTLHNTLASILTHLTTLEQKVSAIEQNGVAPKQVTVTFNANGGTCSITTLQVNVGGTIAVMPTPTKSNYTFLGWYNGTTQYTTATPINAAVTLTAKWQAETKYATITTYPSGKTLNYTGESQELISSGVGTNGIFYYNTTASDTGKSSTVSDSALKHTDAGEYTAYYKFVANAGYTYTNSVWTPVTTTISAAKATITNPGAKTVTFGSSSTVITLSYYGLSTVNVSSSNTNIIATSVSGNTLTLSAKTGTGSATITVNGTAAKNYTAPTDVTFTATAAKATNDITITPAGTTVSVNNGLYSGNTYYTISSISATAGTSSTLTSSDITMIYFVSASGDKVSSTSVSDNLSVNAYFNPSESAKSAKITISNTGDNNYNAASKTITFNFTENSTYKYYIGAWSTKPTSDAGLDKTATSKLTTLTLPAGTNVAQAFIYPASWGTAQFYDEALKSNFGTVKASPFAGYNMTQISAAQADGFGTHTITWSE